MQRPKEAVVSQDLDATDGDLEQYCIIDSHQSEQQSSSADDSEEEEEEEEEEGMRDRIERVCEDLSNITSFYNITISRERQARLQKYYRHELDALQKLPFHQQYSQQDKIDYVLLRNHLEKGKRQLELDGARDEETLRALLPFAGAVVRLCRARQRIEPVGAQAAAQAVHELGRQIAGVRESVVAGRVEVDVATAFRAAKTAGRLRAHLGEWFGFYSGYDPMFTWWVTEPYGRVDGEWSEYVGAIRKHLLGIKSGDDDGKSVIIGDPIGRQGLVAALRAEMIAYTPEDVLRIGEREYAWCEAEMEKASHELGYGSDWRKALEHVKTLFVEPGQQPRLVNDLANEAADYVARRNLVTVPPLAAETIRMYMMSPARQLVNPFFLGGTDMIVSYPTNTMSHDAKLTSMRGNNVHFARSTVLHELIPGHHLQLFMNARHRPYRRLFETSFSVEGWAFYWEMVLWDDARFPKSPENRIGMLFWRMHRCCRILFSINFHLGNMSPQQCIDLLVDKGGHERATAEGEVRRSFAGDYPPLYQAGYMLGALQLYALRREIVGRRVMTEKQFHDRVMREGQMPIELLRALIKNDCLMPDHKASWKFYEFQGS